jgi:NTE family protein
VEDTWRTFFCIAASYSQAAERVIRTGPLAKMVRASLSIPGLLPPVFHQREALMDGGIFNNFPTDVMRRDGAGTIIGVDLQMERFGPTPDIDLPGTFELLRRRNKAGDGRIPSLGGMLFHVPMLVSASRQREAAHLADLLVRPDLKAVGMLQWEALDRAMVLGYEHTVQQLAALDSTLLERLRDA